MHVAVGACSWLLLLQFVLITAAEEMAAQRDRLTEAEYAAQLVRDFLIATVCSLLLSEVFKVAIITLVVEQETKRTRPLLPLLSL